MTLQVLCYIDKKTTSKSFLFTPSQNITSPAKWESPDRTEGNHFICATLLTKGRVETVDLSHRDISLGIHTLDINPISIVDNAIRNRVDEGCLGTAELFIPPTLN